MNEWEKQRRQAEVYKESYPPGTRIVLESMEDDPRPIASGTRGTVSSVDSLGTIHCEFDDGRYLGVIPEKDKFRKLTEEELAEEAELKKIVDFGDGCKIRLPDEPIDCSRVGYFDELEEECWSLVKAYCKQLGIELRPIDEDEAPISFDIAKGIQDKIIEEFENAGVKFKFSEQSEEINTETDTEFVQKL